MDLVYVTGNSSKFKFAQDFLTPFKLNLIQESVDIPEIQAEDNEVVAVDKAKKAYQILKKPLFVSDHGWYIKALNGFPGPYMKDINHWLTSQDLINLMRDHENREVIFKENICFVDKELVKVFTHTEQAFFLHEIKGDRLPSENLISFEGPNGRSIAQVNQETGHSASDPANLWEDFSNWVKEYSSISF
jgi:XTP/dITP diphosphohydrolase